MAKKKTETKLSDAQFLRDKVRKLPLGKCYASEFDPEKFKRNLIVTRIHPNGNITAGLYTVDFGFTGIPDAEAVVCMPPTRFERMVKECGFAEIPYAEAHNMIYGALGFAEDRGVCPASAFASARYVLEPDTDDIPVIEYEFGQHKEDFKNSNVFNTSYNEMTAETARHPRELFACKHTRTRKFTRFHFPSMVAALTDRANTAGLPSARITEFISLPREEAAEDLRRLIINTITDTWKPIAESSAEVYESAGMILSFMLLRRLHSPAALDAVLETMRQSPEFIEYHFGDFAEAFITPALYSCGRECIGKLIAFLDEKGHDACMRGMIYSVLGMTAVYEPARRGEIIDAFRKIITGMIPRIARTDRCDGVCAGLLTAQLVVIGATELTGELKALYETGCVDLSICGDFGNVLAAMKDNAVNPKGLLYNAYRADVFEANRMLAEAMAE